MLMALKALTPYFLKCGKCRTVARVNMRGLHLLVLVAASLVVAGLAASDYTLRYIGKIEGVTVVCGFLAGFLVFEFLAFWIIDRYARLTISSLGPKITLDPAPLPEAMRSPPPESSRIESGDRSPKNRD